MFDITTEKIGAGIIGLLTALIGGWDLTLQVMLVLICADILTGVVKSLYLGTYTSRQFREGLLPKAGFLMVLIICNQLDILMGNSEPVIRTVCAVYYIAIEGSSIVENLGQMGVPVPTFIKNRLARLKETAESNGEEIER